MLDIEVEAAVCKCFLDRVDELVDETDTAFSRFPQFARNTFIYLGFCVLQRQVLQFAFNGMKAQPVGKGGIQVYGFR